MVVEDQLASAIFIALMVTGIGALCLVVLLDSMFWVWISMTMIFSAFIFGFLVLMPLEFQKRDKFQQYCATKGLDLITPNQGEFFCGIKPKIEPEKGK